MAFVFANYSIRLFKDTFEITLGTYTAFAFAGGAILLLTVTNVVGVIVGKTVQNILTLAKIIGLGAVITAGFMNPQPGFRPAQRAVHRLPASDRHRPRADPVHLRRLERCGFCSAEVKDGKKNITRSLVIGILIITLLYLLVNIAYIYSLGFNNAMAQARSPPTFSTRVGKGGVTLMCVLVMVSALGAVNGLIFTGARRLRHHRQGLSILGWMGGWARKKGAPVPALITPGRACLALVFLVGTTGGPRFHQLVARQNCHRQG